MCGRGGLLTGLSGVMRCIMMENERAVLHLARYWIKKRGRDFSGATRNLKASLPMLKS